MFLLSGCGIIRELPEDEQLGKQLQNPPPSEEEAKAQLDEVGSNFVYGSGLGEAMINVGGIIAFPPYGIYVLGDALANLSGYDIKPSAALPEEEQDAWDELYADVASGPGRVTAAMAGTEYRSAEVVKERKKEMEAQKTVKGK